MKKTVRVRFKGKPLGIGPIRVTEGIDPLEVAFFLAKELKRTNPVDTGKSRRAWTVQGHANGNVTVYNKVHYVQYLEKGHSQQAPDGFIRQSMAKTKRWMRTVSPEDEETFEFTGKSVDRLLEAKTIKLLTERKKLEDVPVFINPTITTSDEVVSKLINTLIEEGRRKNTLPILIRERINRLLIALGIIRG